MAYTTHPNELDIKRGLRAGLIGLALAGVAALGYSVAIYDSSPLPAAVDLPSQDEMRAESMETRHATGAGVAGALAAPKAVDLPTQDEMRAENWSVREPAADVMTEQERAAAAIAPALVPLSR